MSRAPTLLECEMQQRGWVHIRGAVPPSTVTALCEELGEELRAPSVPPESGTPRVDLSNTATWPSGGARRVIEAVPTRGSAGAGCCSASEAWQTLINSPELVNALDCLLGAGCWDLPLNEPYHGGGVGSEYVRHWYAPVMFPEELVNIKRGQALSSRAFPGKSIATAPLGDVEGWRTNEGDDWTAEEDAALQDARLPSTQQQPVSWKAVAAAVGGGRTAKQCRERWGGLKSWTAEEDERLLSLYYEFGPAWTKIAQQSGMQDRSKRHVRVRLASLLDANERSAADKVASVAESKQLHVHEHWADRAAAEWEAVNRRRVRGKGWHVDIGPGFSTDWRRTAYGHSYQGVAKYLQSEQLREGVPHQQLNTWCIEEVVRAMSSGQLCYRRRDQETVVDSTPATCDGETSPCRARTGDVPSSDAFGKDGAGDWGAIEQVVGKAGDIVLLHPWCVHSGTTNFGTNPRLMLNGMVRIKTDAGGRATDVEEIPSGVSSKLIQDTLASLDRSGKSEE